MDQKHEEALAGVKKGDLITAPATKVHGAGFLVRRGLVLTARHVVTLIADEYQKVGRCDNWYVQFAYPEEGGEFSMTSKRVDGAFALLDPSGKGMFDVGFLSFPCQEDELLDCPPVNFGELAFIQVGTEIGVCGFPLGNTWLSEAPGVHRYGAAVHRGMISAIAPFNVAAPRRITAFLTDLNSAPGMSGGPVFTLDGLVIGVHYGGTQGTVGCAVPVDAVRVMDWVRFQDEAMAAGRPLGELRLTPSGDIIWP